MTDDRTCPQIPTETVVRRTAGYTVRFGVQINKESHLGNDRARTAASAGTTRPTSAHLGRTSIAPAPRALNPKAFRAPRCPRPDIMPDIIEIGLDVLESVQPEAAGRPSPG